MGKLRIEFLTQIRPLGVLCSFLCDSNSDLSKKLKALIYWKMILKEYPSLYTTSLRLQNIQRFTKIQPAFISLRKMSVYF